MTDTMRHRLEKAAEEAGNRKVRWQPMLDLLRRILKDEEPGG